MNRSALLAGMFIVMSIVTAGRGTSGDVAAKNDPLDKKLIFQKSLAQEIDAYYHGRRINTSAKVIWQVIDEAQKTLPAYFPNGEVGLDHVLAIAALESGFYPTAKGAAGEVGIFQILRPRDAMEGIGRPGQDPFNVRNNTQMGILVLNNKFRTHGNTNRAIIAYNGVVRRRDGTWDDQYLMKFRKNHAMILRMIRKAEETTI